MCKELEETSGPVPLTEWKNQEAGSSGRAKRVTKYNCSKFNQEKSLMILKIGQYKAH